jgi:hypothetical protein
MLWNFAFRSTSIGFRFIFCAVTWRDMVDDLNQSCPLFAGITGA